MAGQENNTLKEIKMKDKIIFWIDGALTHFCLAYYLQKKYDADFYAIIDTTNKPKKFFQEQRLVQFQKTWYYHDHIINFSNPDIEYLSSFEQKYNVNISQLLVNDRFFYRFNRFYKFTDDEILSILEQECKLYENIFEEIHPDFFITKEPALRHHQLFYELCKRKGVKILMLNQPNMGRCIISENIRKIDSIDNLENSEGTRNFDELLQYHKSFLMSKQTLSYAKKFKNSKLSLLKAASEFLFTSENKNIRTHYTYFGRTKFRVLLDSIKLSLKKKIREQFINKNLSNQINFNEKFVYFPLAVDEERNLLIAAPFYTNQIEVIRHIAKSLPIDYKLYVKESPSQSIRYWRPLSEYKEMMKIPNVRLIHPSFSPEILYKNCSLVITIGGSSGYEAAFYGKPSIIFTDLGYLVLPSVEKVKNIEELPKIIRLSLQKKVNPSDLDRYILLLDKNSFEFDLIGFYNIYHDYFYYGGYLTDVQIPIQKMESFLKKFETYFDVLTLEHIKKLNELKKSKKVPL